MTIDWAAFLTVVVGSLVSACLLVALFSLGLRLSDGTARWRRPIAVVVFVACAAVVVFGIYLIVPTFHP
jgi:predicted permease